ncbi:transcriptional regulator, LysR family protein [Plesiocystis pacifica SIR-1]|uniref:Transcriptional regulator, LysR family protein n=1 Tax=Plesiocystis pacifica SIR-1 TaxID=391625 RepID=A6GAR8_9BACT|nr:LysR family transcriptional regulator [Plesiocystis pacifica]EDM77009.1 transcriptional regulator, LysR family protein [Plesiocystis pacifica SIR-1]
MDKLAAMHTFVEIVDAGSLTAAAGSLGCSQPTVVRTLAKLERSLGATLLRRTTRRMSLTNEGRVYLDDCRRILADVAAAEALVSTTGADAREPQGELRLTAPVLFGQRHVCPAVLAFLERHAKVQVDMLLLDRVVDLVDEGIDLAVRIGKLADSSMIARRVGSMRRVVCASPALLARCGGAPGHPKALRALPCVRFRGARSWAFADGLQIRVDGRLLVNQAAAAVQACEQGIGFAAFLAYQVADSVAAGRLEVVLEDHEPPAFPVSLVYADPRLLTPRLRAILDWLAEALSARDAQGWLTPVLF